MDSKVGCRGVFGLLRDCYDREAAMAQAKAPGFAVEFSSLKRIRVRRPCLYPSHRHSLCEIFVPERGPYECEVNGSAFRLDPGEAVFVQPGDLHSDRYLAGSTFLILTFTLLDLEGKPWPHGIMDRESSPSLRKVQIVRSSRLSMLLDAVSLPGEPRQEELPTLEPLCLAFFWELLAQAPASSFAPEFKLARLGDEFKGRLFELFSRTPAREFDAEALASALGMSRRSMECKVKASLGSSPARAFMAWKVSEAAKMLSSGLSVKQAAESLGFANQFHFSKVFKRVSGRAPSSRD